MSSTLKNILTICLLCLVHFSSYGRTFNIIPPPDSTVTQLNGDTVEVVYSYDSLSFGTLHHVDSIMRKPLEFSFEEKEQFFAQLHASIDSTELVQSLGGASSGGPAHSMSQWTLEHADVGLIPINAGISPSGARTYSVPIQTAPGFSMTPSLSLCYNSQGGEGVAGYGWELGGVSAISLINRNKYYHDRNEAADRMSIDAVFALDGIPLVQNIDYATRASYPLETATGHILVSLLTNMEGYVSSFVALYPDGTMATYGHGLGENHLFPTYPLVQMVNKDGERITFHYEVDSVNGNDRLTSVRYGYVGTNVSRAEVVINYSMEEPSSIPSRFYAGSEIQRPWRITGIVSKNGSDTLSCYSLSYVDRDGVKLLSDISCSDAEGHILPDIQFDYGSINAGPDGSGRLEKSDCLNILPETFSSEDHDIIYRRGKFVANSLNDGLLILPYYPEYACVQAVSLFGRFVLAAEYGSLYSADQEIIVVPSVGDYNDYGGTILAGEGFQAIEAVDVDGDGVDEIVKLNNTSINGLYTTLLVSVYKCNNKGAPILSSSFSVQIQGSITSGRFVSPYRRAYYWGDFLGNGKTQLLAISYDKNYNRVHLCNQTSYAALIDIDSGTKRFDAQLFEFPDDGTRRTLACDIDNDSQTELCFATDLGLDVYRWSSGGFVKETTYSSITADVVTSDSCPLYVTDLNGDGYIDMMTAPSKGTGSSIWTRYSFTGTEFRTYSTEICSFEDGDEYMFIDLNRDGLSDLVKMHGTGLGSYINNDGRHFGAYQACTTPISSTKGIVPANVVDYTGMSSFIKIDGHLIDEYSFSCLSPEKRSLTRMTDSFGRYYTNSYCYLPVISLYSVDSSASVDTSLGYYFRTPPVYVLLNEYAYQAAGDWTTNFMNRSHYYQSGVFHSRGLGFCGFSRIRTYEYNGARTEITDEIHAPMNRGVVTNVEKRLGSANSSPIYRITNSYDNHSTVYGKLSPRLVQSSSTDYLTNLQLTSAYSYDALDFPISIVTTRSNGVGAPKTETLKRTYAHSITPQKYILGSVVKESVVREGDAGTPLSWEERTETTLDSKCRPVSQRRYVGENGVTLKEVEPVNNDPGAVLPPEVGPVEPPLVEQPEYPGQPLEPNGPGEPGPDDPGTVPEGSQYMDSTLYNFHKATHLVEKLRWEYDSHGNLTKEESAPYESEVYKGKTYAYDSDGRYLVSETDALGHVAQYGNYNKFGKPGLIVDWRGHRDTLSYDSWGNLVRRAGADGTVEETLTAWGGSGLYTVTRRQTGTPERVSHIDALGREILSGEKRFDGAWLWKRSEYDSLGRVRRISLPYKGESPVYWNSYAYDSYGRLISTTEASGRESKWTYDGASVTSVRDSIATTRIVDANGDLVQVTDGGGTISYALRDDRQPVSVTAPGNIVTSFEYDSLGRRVSMIDPSAGIQKDTVVWAADGTSYATHTGTNGSVTTRFDSFGRTTSLERGGAHSTFYQYDSDGALSAVVSTNGCSRRYTYDALGRISSVRDTVPDNKWLLREYAYKAGSQIDSIRFSSQDGYITTETFNYANGHNTGIRLPDNTPVWSLAAENAEGRVCGIVSGSISRSYGFTPAGLPTYRKMAGGLLQDFSYQFDPLTGNLLSRSDGIHDKTETFAYDTLGRLVTIGPRQIAYDARGNATNIGGVGQLFYEDADHPYRVTAYLQTIDDFCSEYDQTAGYASFNRPSYVSEGGKRADFTYGSDDSRVKMQITQGGSQSILTRYYIADCYEYDQTSTATRERLYLGGDAYFAPMVLQRENGGSWTLYNIGRDYLGSITHIATADGILVAEYSYDPWGRLRNPQTQTVYYPGMEPELLLGRGFTGHEHLRDFCLINMNARLYDPLLGRFLSPDPYVQAPDFTQNFNRYSYALNNPLRYTDESGEFWHLVIGAAIGGVVNLLANWNNIKDHENNRFWWGLGYFGVGALAGAVSAGVGAGVSSSIAGASFWSGFWGTSAAGTATSSFITGAAIGASTGGANGFVTGTGNSLLLGNGFGKSLTNGLLMSTIQGASGALLGGIGGGISASLDGRDFWYGDRLVQKYEMSIPQMNQIGEADCRYEVFRSYDSYYNGTTTSVDELRQMYPGVESNDLLLSKMYADHGMSISKIPGITGTTSKSDLAKILISMIDDNNGVSYEFWINAARCGHATALRSINVYDSGRIAIKLMNPSGAGGNSINQLSDVWFQFLRIFHL